MTDHNRDALIKKAAEAMVEYDNPGVYERGDVIADWDDYVGAARVALAVFEQAHTPTDDELVTEVYLDGKWQPATDLKPGVEYVLRTRRIVQDAPSTKRTGPCGFSLYRCRCELPAEHDGMHECSNHRFSDRALWEQQGKPTDVQVLAALNARELSVRERSGSAKHFNPAPDLSYYSAGNIDDMRAALRAAAATQEGESR